MSLHIDYLVRKEQYQDMIRAAQQDQIVQMLKQHNDTPLWHRQIVGWLGVQMVNWGTMLQNYGMTSRQPSISTSQMHTE